MLKLASLRALIEQCVPDLKRDPERLRISGEDGHIMATGTGTLSFEYVYTAGIVILDYTGHTDALIVPLLAWLQVNQPEQLDNPARREHAIEFQIEHLNDAAADIGIYLELTERAIVRRDPQPGAPHRLTVNHPDEPPLVGMDSRADVGVGVPHPPGADGAPSAPLAERWELWLRDQKLAEWDSLPPPARELFRPALS